MGGKGNASVKDNFYVFSFSNWETSGAMTETPPPGGEVFSSDISHSIACHAGGP